MKKSLPPAVDHAFDLAVAALLKACPQATDPQAEAVVEAFSSLVFVTLQSILEEQNDGSVSH